MGLKEKVFKSKAGDKSKVDSPVNDADYVAKEYVKLDAIKQVRKERKEKRYSKESSGRSSKGSSVVSEPVNSDKTKGAGGQTPTNSKKKRNPEKSSGGGKLSIGTDKNKTIGPPLGRKVDIKDKKIDRNKKVSAKFSSEVSSEGSSIESKSVLGASDESIKISIREKYLLEDITGKQKKRRRWSWGDGFTKRLLNASRKVFGKRATVDSDAQEDVSYGEGRKGSRLETVDALEEGSEGSHSAKRKKFGFFARWRQKLKKTKNKDGDEPRKQPKKNYFLFLKRRKRRIVESPADDNRAEWVGTMKSEMLATLF